MRYRYCSKYKKSIVLEHQNLNGCRAKKNTTKHLPTFKDVGKGKNSEGVTLILNY